MDDRIVRLESTVEQLRQAIESLQLRIDGLERDRPAAAVASAGDVVGDSSARTLLGLRSPGATAVKAHDPIVALSLIGRLFLVLAGGFFLRALTEAGALPATAGISLAFLYALLWLALADRASRLEQPTSALFHAVGAAIVAFPLLVEATTRFAVLGVAGSVLGLALLTFGFLFVAVRRRAYAVAWITVVAALPTCVVLLVKTGVPAPYALYLILFGVGTVWLAHAHGWSALRWPVALAADIAVAGMTLRTLAPEHSADAAAAILLQMTLVGACVTTIALRTLLRHRQVTPFEIVQTALALLVGFGGAIMLTRSSAAVPGLMGLASLVFGAACYAFATRIVGTREVRGWNAWFYTTLALVLVIAGLALDLRGPWLGAVLAVLAVLAVATWFRRGRLYLLLHGVAYLVAAGIASGALRYGGWALVSSPEKWVRPAPVMVAVAVAAALCAWFAARQADPQVEAPAKGARLVVVVVLVWVASGCVVGLLASTAAGPGDGAVDLGVLATIRTGVLAAATLLVALVARRDGFREWAWLVYPLLVFVGLKMVAQDFGHSRPATLFIALAFYGAALIVAPRLRKARGRDVVADHRSEPAEST